MDLPKWQAVLLLVLVLLGIYALMWRGWRRRGRKHDLPPLVPVPAVAELPEARLSAGARYFGTTVAGDWLDRVVAHGLGARSACRLQLSTEGLDVVRLAGSFRIPAEALRGARHDQGIAGKVVPPHGILVVTWRHGDLTLDTGFRLTEPDGHDTWVRSISTMAKRRPEPAEGENA
ncbi:hypothetical protein [Nocardioides mesophilus]|uniref:PH domain-containing protein n=1 Tax=Nocardioides mesophilus TaxID=433659 RepID=A0A7G9RAC8_9ACTN|nr:hypothetical protein [Nocardioides mesophilus]QNN52553.1 hypothetical protein H9L09_19160 [Nocardioides mesophilus]